MTCGIVELERHSNVYLDLKVLSTKYCEYSNFCEELTNIEIENYEDFGMEELWQRHSLAKHLDEWKRCRLSLWLCDFNEIGDDEKFACEIELVFQDEGWDELLTDCDEDHSRYIQCIDQLTAQDIEKLEKFYEKDILMGFYYY